MKREVSKGKKINQKKITKGDIDEGLKEYLGKGQGR